MNTLKLKWRAVFSVILFAGLGFNLFSQQIDFQHMKKHIAIVNVGNLIKLKGKVTNNSVYTITLKDYSGKNLLPEGFGFNGFIFSDDGEKNDQNAGDGIYTSHEFVPSKNLSAYANQVYGDETFQHGSQVQSEGGPKITIKCKFVKDGCCPCPGEDKTCPVCYWFGWSCWSIQDCEIGVTLQT